MDREREGEGGGGDERERWERREKLSCLYYLMDVVYLYYYSKGFTCLGSPFSWFKDIPTPLGLNRDKI